MRDLWDEMKIPELYTVRMIKKQETYPWILNRHYAHRLPSINHAIGLFDNQELMGICTFGVPPNYIEPEAWKPFDLLELNRLCLEENMKKNTLSYFVSNAIQLLSKPTVLISYSDMRFRHHGYIYQATNWIYTGTGGGNHRIYITSDGRELHERTVDIGDGGAYKKELIDSGVIINTIKTTEKHRYYYFHGNKRDKKKMLELLRFPIKTYPKGSNQRYDASGYIEKQQHLF